MCSNYCHTLQFVPEWRNQAELQVFTHLTVDVSPFPVTEHVYGSTGVVATGPACGSEVGQEWTALNIIKDGCVEAFNSFCSTTDTHSLPPWQVASARR